MTMQEPTMAATAAPTPSFRSAVMGPPAARGTPPLRAVGAWPHGSSPDNKAQLGLPGAMQIGLPGTMQIGLPGTMQIGLPGTMQIGLPGTMQIGLPGLVQLLGGEPGATAAAAMTGEPFALHRVERGATLVFEGGHADRLYVVQSGSFKCVKTAEDGYEYVLGFTWRGDVIGYDGVAASRYAFSAIALEDSRVVVLPLARLDALRHAAPAFDAALQAIVSRQLTHAGEIAEVMAAVAADVRLARFLVQLSARMAERGQSPRRLLLRMNRRDIANHLGLAHETISRSFRMLAERGWLRVDNRNIDIADLDSLKRCGRSTRGAGGEEDRCAAAPAALAHAA
jgi:CRP/FNR family transcriptional regulator, anaerobic regulatory protein